ncbi:hypothetical protein ACTVMR_07045 [Serratia nevei]|uniref:hypothetical protein n=1 Tax=Serratia nevei TaxID=2703794 RepID=UPI003FA79A23
MSSSQGNSDQTTGALIGVAGTIIGAVLAASAVIFSSWLSNNQADKSADRASALQQKNICLERFNLKEDNLRNHASAFLGGIGAYYNVLTQFGFYGQDNNLLVKNLSLVSLEGMKTIAYSSNELTKITFEITDLASSIFSSEGNQSKSEDSVLKKLDTLKRDWVVQYQKDISKIGDDRKDCTLSN